MKKSKKQNKKKKTKYQLLKQTNNNTYHPDGANKKEARGKMSKFIGYSGVNGTILTLPNEDWIIEKDINKQTNGMDFIGVEYNEGTFKKMAKNLKKLKLKAKTHFGSISELIYGKIENTYAHLILDYCGELSTFMKEIQYAIENDIVKIGGIIAITFAKPIRATDEKGNTLKELAPNNNSDLRCMSDRAIEGYYHKVTGFNYKVVEFFYYQDTYPMTLVIIKRVK